MAGNSSFSPRMRVRGCFDRDRVKSWNLRVVLAYVADIMATSLERDEELSNPFFRLSIEDITSSRRLE